MKAVCVTPTRSLEVREVPTPTNPPAGHVLLKIEAAGINPGDKAFLARPLIATGLNTSLYDIWGASAAGTVLSIGPGVPSHVVDKRVALYRSLTPSPATIGLWSEYAVLPWTSCLILPDSLSPVDYSATLVNAITAYAFLELMVSEGHKGVIVTAGNSATGLALSVLARERNIPALFLVRSDASREALLASGAEHVLATSDDNFETQFAQHAERLQTTAVFDGVGGDLITRIAPHLPAKSTVWFYGFLAGAAPIAIPSGVFMSKNLTMKPFSNFNSPTVQDPRRLAEALTYLQGVISNPLFRTPTSETFSFEQIEAAMAFTSTTGGKAILVPRHD